MATVVMVTQTPTHAAATNTQAALTGLGHTVTVVDDASVTSTNLDGYDLIVVVRSAIAGATIRPYLDAGRPMLIATVEAGVSAGAGQVALPTDLRLAGTFNLIDNTAGLTESVIVHDTHDIVAPYAVDQRVAMMAGANFVAALENGQLFVGDKLSTGDPDSAVTAGMVDLIAVEKGTNNLDAAAVGARVVIWGWLYGGQSDYSADGKATLGRAVTWAVATPPVVAEKTYSAGQVVIGVIWDRGTVTGGFMDPVAPFIDRYDPTSWKSGVTLSQQRVLWDDMDELVGTGGGGGGGTGGESVTGSMLNRGLN